MTTKCFVRGVVVTLIIDSQGQHFVFMVLDIFSYQITRFVCT
jgi:hypothetical protein